MRMISPVGRNFFLGRAVLSMQGVPAHNTIVFIKVLYFCYSMAGIVEELLGFPAK
jgi:hypothetical protein